MLSSCAVAGNSPADQTQQLFVGDALVEVNGTFVAHLDLEKIIMIIATAGKHITLKVMISLSLSISLHAILPDFKSYTVIATTITTISMSTTKHKFCR